MIVNFFIGMLAGAAALAMIYYVLTDMKKRKAVVVNKPKTTGGRTQPTEPDDPQVPTT